MTAAYQRAAEWKNGGICGTAQEKEKHCSSKERTMQITSCCASSWPWISLRWKFWKKKWRSKPSEVTSGTTFQLKELWGSWNFFQDGDTVTFIESSGRCWLVCFPVPDFCNSTCYLRSHIQCCYLSPKFQWRWTVPLPFFMLMENLWLF